MREPCASSSQHEPAGNRRFHCSMLLEHMHHWSRNLLRFFVAARTCRQQTLPLLHAARTHASVEPQATATYEPLWRWLTMSRSCSLRPSPAGSRGGHRKCDHGRLGGSFWIRLRLEKAVAGPGVRGQDDRDKWKQTSFFLGIQRRRLAPKVRPWEARFGPELDWEKLSRDQVFGAKMTETNGNKLFFLGIQRQRLAPKVRPWEARRIRLGKAVAGPGVRGQDDRDK